MKKLLSFFLLLFVMCLAFPALADMEVLFLDVENGGCAIVICDGEAAIINGGPSFASSTVFASLQELNVTEIKYAFITSPQADYVGGLPAAFRAASVGALYSPVAQYEDARFSTLVKTASSRSVPVIVPAVGDQLPLGSATITILSPSTEQAASSAPAMALRIVSKEMTLLVSSDGRAESTVEPASKGLYIGNRNSNIYHRIDCDYVEKMSDENKVTLNSKEEAESRGYRPCKKCGQ